MPRQAISLSALSLRRPREHGFPRAVIGLDEGPNGGLDGIRAIVDIQGNQHTPLRFAGMGEHAGRPTLMDAAFQHRRVWALGNLAVQQHQLRGDFAKNARLPIRGENFL